MCPHRVHVLLVYSSRVLGLAFARTDKWLRDHDVEFTGLGPHDASVAEEGELQSAILNGPVGTEAGKEAPLHPAVLGWLLDTLHASGQHGVAIIIHRLWKRRTQKLHRSGLCAGMGQLESIHVVYVS
ncbi:uncharacterized protein BJ171DRAFT_553056 [Polychytrium aggregatum]|uniref:uncharacterized protein n=1 Tax=Polychytrium aggregatum TaxID=110093 RepID=UPI0022FF395C|nr:uncharacterized protein BJ171DRAFT_553056 [Polychytrium aggregatum]KAI9183776.1 hypothetical protein BJ171DRAFT_553056 [Polychytrium aggregatum]